MAMDGLYQPITFIARVLTFSDGVNDVTDAWGQSFKTFSRHPLECVTTVGELTLPRPHAPAIVSPTGPIGEMDLSSFSVVAIPMHL